MRFSVVAILAGAALAQAESTVWKTDLITITSCAATVTNCPARSTQISTTVYPVKATETSIVATSKYANATVPAVKTSTATSVKVSAATSIKASSATLVTSAAACPAYSVKTIATEITTVIPTFIYETVAVPCASASAKPSSGIAPAGGNGTVPTAPASPSHSVVVTAGAASAGVSLVAAAVGFAAVFLA